MQKKKKILMTMAALSLLIWGAAVTAQELSEPKIEKDIVYGKPADGEELKLDLARPTSGEGPFPLIIFLHGGGWRMGDRSEYHEGALIVVSATAAGEGQMKEPLRRVSGS